MNDTEEKWYVLATLDGGHINDGVSPLAILGPWSRDLAQTKCDMLRTNHPKSEFDVQPHSAIDWETARVKTK